jgi:hypothetical protein
VSVLSGVLAIRSLDARLRFTMLWHGGSPAREACDEPNRGFAQWGEVFGDPIVATALLDRLLHHAIVIQIEGSSYRLRQHADLVPAQKSAFKRALENAVAKQVVNGQKDDKGRQLLWLVRDEGMPVE